ncbi:hypothetical protein EAH88_07170 [Rhodanobacter glycinis]|uniref:DUF1501 domain-containing protein n=1 Tax=Rhodanobacter glycinis TaxID=582702 RepID=A0A502CB00_9GAMM|nr:hypothetical protein [Rhodanobacter glycinis]TPG10138.1 hypothetical protein EAH88_07170 [Rhodanobacter glycinis]
MNDPIITRRTVLKAGATLAGAFALGGLGLRAKTHGGRERPTLVVLWLNGGPAGLFNSADSFLSNGAYGVTADNVRVLANGLCVDAGSLGALPESALTHMASIGFRHGRYPHTEARTAMLERNSHSLLLQMAAAMPDGAARCAIVNSLGLPVGVATTPPAERGTVFERIVQFEDVNRHFPAAEFDNIRHAYGVPTGSTTIDNQRATFASIESLILADVGVIFAQPAYTGRPDRQFDTHHDDAGTLARDIMTPITPSLITFLDRVMALPERNVVTLLVGEFSRTLPGADHAPGGTATVIGKYVKTGTTGRQLPDGSPPEHAASPEALWAYAAAALRLGGAAPFGRNPHPELLV